MSNANSARAFRDLHQSGLLILPNAFTLLFSAAGDAELLIAA